MLFGKAPITPKQLVAALRDRVTEIARKDDPREMKTAYTKAVKAALSEIACKYGGCAVYTQRRISEDHRVRQREFMLDFVWCCDPEDRPQIQKMLLAVESEWGSNRGKSERIGQVRRDFRKLLSFKAPLKLFLFSAKDPKERKRLHATIVECLLTFGQHVKGEQYVIMEFPSRRRERYCYFWKAPSNGVCKGIGLKAMDRLSRIALGEDAPQSD